ncbi:hypothetical protein CK203_026192 [Vitis vinifera]|uniref:EF-hand domain-containing protein n=1 Tax=Vitis vinifera TaxID=29760 RepID=A0A438ILB3_VITVI|nr:hypothetical protein CK203_026192 [Vitis vinifera]
MSVEVLDGATIVSFVEDEEAFMHFGIDVKEIQMSLLSLRLLFVKFDHDANGAVDLEEFRKETKQMMLAMANGLGFLLFQMVLEEDSFLKKAVQREAIKMDA